MYRTNFKFTSKSLGPLNQVKVHSSDSYQVGFHCGESLLRIRTFCSTLSPEYHKIDKEKYDSIRIWIILYVPLLSNLGNSSCKIFSLTWKILS